MYDYIIIGGGVTGITLCKKLRERGIDNILVLEKADEPGGLCRTKEIDGHILDIGGGHFFHTKHQEIFDYVFKYLPKNEFNYYKRVSKIEMGKTTIDYPIESNVWQLPMEEQIEYLISIIRNGQSLNKKEPENYEEWVRWKLGDRICDAYMIPYNTKLWGVKPKEMDIDWLYKIPNVDVREVLKYSLERKQDVNKFPAHIHFYYPKKEGFGKIVKALVKDELSFIKCSCEVMKLRYIEGNWIVNDVYVAKRIINTTPWNDLYHALGCPDEIASAVQKIKYNRIVVSLFEKDYDVDWHWRYIPDPNKAHHREFYIHNYAEDSKKNGIYLETGIKRFNEKEMPAGGKASIVDFYTDAAYPIPVTGHAQAIREILDFYRPMGFYGVGRWGQHEYQNADVSMHEAIKFVDSLP